MLTVDDLIAAEDAALVEARRQHESGTWHLSEWSCSWCEREESS